MEHRITKLIVSNSGGTASKGSKTYKVVLPNSWVKELELDDSRINIMFDGKSICITKSVTPIEFAFNKKAMNHIVKKLTFYNGELICSILYVDFTDKTLMVENNDADAVKLAFGNNLMPTWQDFENFLKERCVPRERSGIREYLEVIGVDNFDYMEIIQKTKGKMAEDNQWINVEDF